ncbi:NAD(P)-dependent dehydrogenase (short-subunit alcohol dehydrogenase family) [Halospina denitrificans]|uniref:NAD(P)-dependent dehydrogenase (Short-subunit alcohol dehydrogenase family) n=1 Tax=Halospina denitrificans TaxID=332522 RepID=A0A4R7K417_9GAMM|nr:SDR family NAD(P)-dependent oxidoreductase [Halospina denitrificans]TDT44379.1 NAD(P)-dependent dehydrogenase (short-subunit alcohol dehydrogenase family) [Halospina denitrificans]
MTTLIAGISGGIGLAMAEHELIRAPEARIIGLSRHASHSEGALGLQSSYPDRATLIDADVGDPDHLRTAFERSIPAETRIQQVIFAIGVLHGPELFPEKRLEDIQPQAMMHSYETNTLGFLLLVQALIPWLRHRDPKLIAAISAKVGSIGDNEFGGWYAYRCSKAALNMAVRTLAIETRRRLKPATVVALHPGTTETNLTAPFQQSLARLRVHSPADTANNLWQVLDGLTPEDSGSFLNWDGSTLPW